MECKTHFWRAPGEALVAIFALSAQNGAEWAPREVRGPRLSPFSARHSVEHVLESVPKFRRVPG
eukprot:13584551-Alexandrium_andersonii.AAC.1